MGWMAQERQPSSARKPFDIADATIGIACGVAVTFTAIFLGLMPLVRSYSGSRDFVVYWATGQQLLHHANPYDAAAMGRIEHAAGLAIQGSYFMRNPPWGLPLTLPLGLISAQAGALPWSLLMLGLLILSVRILWKTFGRPGTHLELLGYIFPPALMCVMQGQTSILVLLGLVLFLRWRATHPLLAGAAMWLCTLKPHLFLPFAAVLAVWIVVAKSYRLLAGFAVVMAASCAATLWIDPAIVGQYTHWMKTSGISHEVIPCASVFLRNLVNPSAQWLTLVPAVLASIGALAWYWSRRDRWDWVEDGSLLMLVSVLVAPYCWIWDECLAIPALLFMACRTESRKTLALLGVLYIVFELQPFFSSPQTSPANLWLAPAWLAWCLWARRGTHSGQLAPRRVSAQAPSLG